MDRTLISTQSVFQSVNDSMTWAGLRPWLRPVALLLLVTFQVVSLVLSSGGQALEPIAQAAATPQIPVANGDVATGTIRTSSLQEISAAIHAAEFLVLELWQATGNPGAPIESPEWLVAYFQQGWAPDMARELASYYSYFDGTHHYLRFTDDVLPPLLMATTITVDSADERAAVVEAKFPALDGPFQLPASSRLYFLIKEDGTWKIESITLSRYSVGEIPNWRLKTVAK